MMCCLVSESSAPSGALEAIARACSPRIEVQNASAVVFDASGLDRVLGSPSEIAREVRQLAAGQGVTIRVALAPTTMAAWLIAHAVSAVTVAIDAEEAAETLSALPIRWLATLPDEWILTGPTHRSGTRHLALGTRSDPARTSECLVPSAKCLTTTRPSSRHYRMAPGPATTRSEIGGAVRGSTPPAMPVVVFDLLATLERWGLRTLGDVARLPRADVHARLGPPGVRLHQAACGQDTAWFVPADAAPRFLERHVLDWPIEALEPLSFVLARLLDALSATLERADRGAVEIATRLQLVTRGTHTRLLNLPAPMRDARVLRTLILLDLESHPPPAAIDIVEVEVGVVPGRIVQGTLLARATPTPEHLSTLIARLGALMGETRVGAPRLLDTHDDRPVAMKMFAPVQQTPSSPTPGTQEHRPGTCIRRFRIPLSARVQVEHGAPVHVAAPVVSAGEVVACAGPWRSSGGWWALDGTRWDRDEWDVELAGGECYRLARDRTTNRWEIDGELD